MSAWHEVNLNQLVRVKLTDCGWDILREEKEAYTQKFPQARWTLPKPDSDGYVQYQMWTLMQTFGQHMTAGSETPFEIGMLLQMPTPPEAP